MLRQTIMCNVDVGWVPHVWISASPVPSRASNNGLKRPKSLMFPMAATFRYHQALKFFQYPHEVIHSCSIFLVLRTSESVSTAYEYILDIQS